MCLLAYWFHFTITVLIRKLKLQNYRVIAKAYGIWKNILMIRHQIGDFSSSVIAFLKFSTVEETIKTCKQKDTMCESRYFSAPASPTPVQWSL